MAGPRGPAIGFVDLGRRELVRVAGQDHVVELQVLMAVSFRGDLRILGAFVQVEEVEVAERFDCVNSEQARRGLPGSFGQSYDKGLCPRVIVE